MVPCSCGFMLTGRGEASMSQHPGPHSQHTSASNCQADHMVHCTHMAPPRWTLKRSVCSLPFPGQPCWTPVLSAHSSCCVQPCTGEPRVLGSSLRGTDHHLCHMQPFPAPPSHRPLPAELGVPGTRVLGFSAPAPWLYAAGCCREASMAERPPCVHSAFFW